MAVQKLLLPQQKTFIQEANESLEAFDKRINKWAKEVVLAGDHPSPSGVQISNTEGRMIVVHMYATTIEK